MEFYSALCLVAAILCGCTSMLGSLAHGWGEWPSGAEPEPVWDLEFEPDELVDGVRVRIAGR